METIAGVLSSSAEENGARRGGVDNVEWSTPQPLYLAMHRRFRYGLDCAATAANTKCRRFYTKLDDGLRMPWDAPANWCNLPFGRKRGDVGGTGAWMEHGRREWERTGNTNTLLCPVKADTRWWDETVWGFNLVIASGRIPRGPLEGRWYLLDERAGLVEVLELCGRTAFVDSEGIAAGSGWFATALVTYGVPPSKVLGGRGR